MNTSLDRLSTKACSLALAIIAFTLSGCATTPEKPSIDKADASVSSTGNFAKRPTASEISLGPGDQIEISVFRQPDLTRRVQIPPDGHIFYPWVGDIQVAGMSVPALRSRLADALSGYIVDPQVTILIMSLKSEKVYVLGEVYKPGVIPIDGRMDSLEAIAAAGGFNLDARWTDVVLIRREPDRTLLTFLDLKKALQEADLAEDVALQGGDILFVPPTAIADVARFADYLNRILTPIIQVEQAIAVYPALYQALTGKTTFSRQVIISVGK